MSRVERWLFAPGDPRRLAAVRIGLCSVLALRLLRDVYVELAGQDPALFRPVSFMRLLPGMPPRGLVMALQVAGVAAAVLAAVGLRSRLTLPLAWGCGALLLGMASSLGKVAHNDVIVLACLIPLLAAPVGEAWSVDAALARRARNPSLHTPARHGWPVRTAMVVVAGAYFFTGLAKLVLSGPAWVLTDNMRFILYADSDARAVPNEVALFIADRPWLAHAVAAATLLLEVTFPLVLWRPRAAWLYVPGAILLHAGIFLAMRLDYWAWVATLLVVFVDWPAVADRLGSRAGRPAPLTIPASPP